jgi:hypothetical protein
MAAPNLNEQTRSTVLEVGVEELSSAQNATSGNGATASFGTSMDRQMEAINQAQSRLSQTLTPDELRQTEAFFEQLDLGVEMVRGMTSGLPAQPRQQ